MSGRPRPGAGWVRSAAAGQLHEQEFTAGDGGRCRLGVDRFTPRRAAWYSCSCAAGDAGAVPGRGRAGPPGCEAAPGGQVVKRGRGVDLRRSGGGAGDSLAQAVSVRAAASRPSSATEVSRILNLWTLPVTVMGK